MDVLVANVRSTVAAAVGASCHVVWYVRFQIGSDAGRER